MSGKKTLFLFANSQMANDFVNEKDIEVVITTKNIYKKYKSHILHALHSKVKLVFVK